MINSKRNIINLLQRGIVKFELFETRLFPGVDSVMEDIIRLIVKYGRCYACHSRKQFVIAYNEAEKALFLCIDLAVHMNSKGKLVFNAFQNVTHFFYPSISFVNDKEEEEEEEEGIVIHAVSL